ncbi:hypothetical protein [Noviherbaspirillum galbum]|uniref:VWFA domain-containing protein n=1 Tax=Noviherbaspirillum galbum TaxID=2709383 RepID=A0A6B3SSE5_9BURK|nr:hypothetical protein [Noviherbaspirillum galbum]NEX63378.1 hypothetical protein [Noviherbaspirillum galbum]
MQVDHVKSMLLLARMLAARYNMKVVLTASKTASVTPDTISLPRKWVEGTAKSREATEMLAGVLDHECVGHARHTDFTVMPKYRAKGRMQAFLLNALEDIRIETCASRVYPGVARNLVSMVDYLSKQGFFGTASQVGANSPKHELGNAILVLGRARLLAGQDVPLAAVANAYAQFVAAQYGSLWPKIWDLVCKAPDAETTVEVGHLVDQIWKLIRQVAGEDPADASDPTANRAARHIETDPNANMTESGDIGEKIGKALASSPLSRDAGQIHPSSRKARVAPIPQEWMDVSARVKAALGRDFEALMEAKTECRKSVGLTGRRIHSGSLHRVKTLDARIMMHRIMAEGISTAVSMVVDVSASMSDKLDDGTGISRLQATGGVMVALADLLELHDVPFSAWTFDDGYCCIKQFDERWGSHKGRDKVLSVIGGSTYADQALVESLADLACRDEERKLLVFLTDGDSSNMKQVEAAFRDAEYLGVDMAVVLIGKEFEHHVDQYKRITGRPLFVTDTMQTLAKTVINAVRVSI